VADEITDHADLIGFLVRDFHLGELVFDRDHQFEAVEPVGSEIVSEVRFIGDALDIDAEMLGDQRTNFV
jgi:hypothetical protein